VAAITSAEKIRKLITMAQSSFENGKNGFPSVSPRVAFSTDGVTW